MFWKNPKGEDSIPAPNDNYVTIQFAKSATITLSKELVESLSRKAPGLLIKVVVALLLGLTAGTAGEWLRQQPSTSAATPACEVSEPLDLNR